MTTKELLAKAKAVGGWYVNIEGKIRTRVLLVNMHEACPIESVFGTIRNCPHDLFRLIAVAADNDTDLSSFDPIIRAEMESWCK